jgi:hypothetical protein
MGLFKKKNTAEKIAAKRVNYAGESMDKLDAEGNLPFGWVTHNRKYVDLIENDMKPFREAIYTAKGEIEKYAALKSFLLYLQDGKKHYCKFGECVGKYFEDYICDSEEAAQRRKEYKELVDRLEQ